jgi:formiminoglutamate deiminase
MTEAVIDAADEAGIRLVLLPAAYVTGGHERFRDSDVDVFLERARRLGDGVAAHSVRAVPEVALKAFAPYVERDVPVHVHLSEQVKENEDCLAAHGLTPTGLLAEHGVLGPMTSAVHATHLTDGDIELLGTARSYASFCPTTERDLGDGIGPFPQLRDVGVRLCLGSDSHAVVDAFEETRALETNTRLATGQRVVFSASELLRAATSDGMDSLGWPAGGLAPGEPADFTTVRTDTPRAAGGDPSLAASALFSASASDVDTVVVAGEPVVEAGAHRRVEDPVAELDAAIRRVWEWHR